MKVLHLISSAGQYGAENVVLELASALEALGCGSTIGVFENAHRPNLEVFHAAERRGLKTLRIPCSGRFDRKTVRQVSDFLKETATDVVHSHGYKSNFYGFWGARRAQAATVATCHGWPGKNFALRAYYALDRTLLREFGAVVAVSDVIAHTLRKSGVSENRIRRIENGVDTAKFCKVAATRRSGAAVRIGFVGRLAPEKGLGYLFHAFQDVMREFPAAEIRLIGEGPEHESLLGLSKELGIEHNIYFDGYSNDIAGTLASFDIFVLPSTSEGMPLALLEAMAAGKPVIASAVGAIPTVVLQDRTGQLTAPASVNDLKSALLRYLREPVFAGAMGANAQELVREKYSSEAMARNYLAVYSAVTFARSPRSLELREATRKN